LSLVFPQTPQEADEIIRKQELETEIETSNDLTLIEKLKQDLLNNNFNSLKNTISGVITKEVSLVKACEQLVKKSPIYYDENTVWWLWKEFDKKWVMIDEIDILNQVNMAFDWDGITNSNIKQQFITALKMVARKNKPLEAPKEWIQFKDVIIDLLNGNKIVPESKYFLTNPLSWRLGVSEDTPLLDGLFLKWAGADKDALYELFAYCLYRDYPIQRLFVLLGSGSNGKGSFLRVLRRFIGVENSTSSDLDKITQSRFETAKLYKKLMCEIAETNVNLLKFTSTIKRLSGGDLIGAEWKGKTGFDFVNYAKVIIATNSLPMTLDKTDGFYRRWNIIEFKSKFMDGKEVSDAIPECEYENLALKCVRVLRNLLNNGQFCNDGSIEARMERYEMFSNPLKAFINQNYTKGTGRDDYVSKEDFNKAFYGYLKSRGFRWMSQTEINKALASMGFEVRKIREGDDTFYAVMGLSEIVPDVLNVPLLFT